MLGVLLGLLVFPYSAGADPFVGCWRGVLAIYYVTEGERTKKTVCNDFEVKIFEPTDSKYPFLTRCFDGDPGRERLPDIGDRSGDTIREAGWDFDSEYGWETLISVKDGGGARTVDYYFEGRDDDSNGSDREARDLAPATCRL